MEKHVKELIGREVSRKDFLKLLAGGAVVLFGLNNLIAYFMQAKHSQPGSLPTTHGFGSRKFGE
jgi:hypothetical protein